MTQQNTRERLLDSAENLLAKEGYHNATLRAITNDAGVNLAAVNYHFCSKELLVKEVFARKLIPANKIRQEKLAEVIQNAQIKGLRPNIKDVLRAMIEPTIQFASSDPGRSFAKLIGRSMIEPEGILRDYFFQFAEPVFKVFYDSLCQALPDHSREDILYRMQFTLAAMGITIQRIVGEEVHFIGINSSGGRVDVVEKLIDYAAAGLEA